MVTPLYTELYSLTDLQICVAVVLHWNGSTHMFCNFALSSSLHCTALLLLIATCTALCYITLKWFLPSPSPFSAKFTTRRPSPHYTPISPSTAQVRSWGWRGWWGWWGGWGWWWGWWREWWGGGWLGGGGWGMRMMRMRMRILVPNSSQYSQEINSQYLPRYFIWIFSTFPFFHGIFIQIVWIVTSELKVLTFE